MEQLTLTQRAIRVADDLETYATAFEETVSPGIAFSVKKFCRQKAHELRLAAIQETK